MNALVQVQAGRPATTSRVVAEKFRKRHDTVLRAIRNLDCSPEFNARNFAAVSYLDAKGERRPEYLISRDGFAILAMGFTGREAMRWKEAFIAAFNAMERGTVPPHDPAVPYDRDRVLNEIRHLLGPRPPRGRRKSQ